MSRNFIFSVATRAWRFLPAKLFYTFAIGAKDVPGYFREFAGTLRRKWEPKIDQKCTKTDTNAARAHEKRLTKQEEKLELSPRLAWGARLLHDLFHQSDDLGRLDQHFLGQRLQIVTLNKLRVESFFLRF